MNKCKNCGGCCQYGSGFLAEGDKEPIANFLNITIEELENEHLEKVYMFGTEAWKPKHPKPFGQCNFYDEKEKCTIHEVKPTLCKEGNCWENKAYEFYEKHFVKDNEESKAEWELTQEVMKIN